MSDKITMKSARAMHRRDRCHGERRSFRQWARVTLEPSLCVGKVAAIMRSGTRVPQ